MEKSNLLYVIGATAAILKGSISMLNLRMTS